ncbi:helix-turn-helix domain-containing protein [Bacillus cereus]|uniref:XRE family transcriptional regulator n=1 Tax=Bacillus cereus TaxID=1396 RepID=A0A9X7M0R5_BACCE|nr:helix-turn-helix transcriptional regulator [Bacillus cereus]MDA2637885.1 helix-turn-helix transcriptional regulator [Bacillus cereus]QDZ76625.1 XRE family transcriptional regulator [Bacillus cereus]
MNPNVFGQNIKKLRTMRGLSRYELADDLNISYRTISSWEVGEKMPRIHTIHKLAEYFNVSESYLLHQVISDEELFQRVEGEEDPVHRLARLLYDKYMSVPEEYRPKIERELLRYANFLKLEAEEEHKKE